MKEFARISISLPENCKHIKERLEAALSKEVCIAANISENYVIDAQNLPYKTTTHKVHHNVLAKPEF